MTATASATSFGDLEEAVGAAKEGSGAPAGQARGELGDTERGRQALAHAEDHGPERTYHHVPARSVEPEPQRAALAGRAAGLRLADGVEVALQALGGLLEPAQGAPGS